MSNSTLTPKEKLSAYQRWEMNDFQQQGGGAQPKARTTAEAKFAHACDRFQPMLLNARTEGGSWRKHHVTHDQAQGRSAPVADGSTVLWEAIEQMLREAVAAGHLAPTLKK